MKIYYYVMKIEDFLFKQDYLNENKKKIYFL